MFVIITQNICSCCFCLNYSIWGYKVLMLLVALRILMFHCCNLLRISVQLNRNYFTAAWKNNIFYTNKKKKLSCFIFFQCSKNVCLTVFLFGLWKPHLWSYLSTSCMGTLLFLLLASTGKTSQALFWPFQPRGGYFTSPSGVIPDAI